MLSRLQQALTIGMIALSLLWAAWSLSAGYTWMAAVGVLLILCGYGAFLGLEFAFLSTVNGHDPAPKARLAALVTAWWGEVRAAPLVFCWRQPFRSRRWPDLVQDHTPGRRGLVLVHGFFCNRGLWNHWLQVAHQQNITCIAVNLEPVFGSIDDYMDTLDEAITRVKDLTGLAPVVVAHSMGGLVVRRWWLDSSDDDAVHRVITIGTPHRGTWLARFGLAPNARQMQVSSRWLQQLSGREPATRASRFTCFYGHCDNIVFPASTATLPGAVNRHLDAVAHMHMVDHPAPLAETQRWLASDLPAPC